MTIDAVLVPVQPGAKKASAVVGGNAASQGDAGQLFAAMLGQWLYALEGAQGQSLGEENPAIIPAGKEANSGIATEGREGINPFLWARGSVQPGMDGQTAVSTGSELDEYKERIIKYLDELNGEIIIPRQGTKEAGLPDQAQEVRSKLIAQVFSLSQAQSLGFEETDARVRQGIAGLTGNTGFTGNGQVNLAQNLKSVAGHLHQEIELTENQRVVTEHPRAGQVPANGTPEETALISIQGEKAPKNGETVGTENQDSIQQLRERAFYLNSKSESASSKTNAEIELGSVYLQDISKLGDTAKPAQKQAEKSSEMGILQSSQPPVMKSYGLGKTADSKDQGLNVSDAQALREQESSPDRIAAAVRSGISGEAEEASNEQLPDNRSPNGKPQIQFESQGRSELVSNFGLERTGTGENNSYVKQIGIEAVNGNRGYSPVWDRIAEAVLEQRNSPEVKELQLQLHPAELGKIKVSLHWQDGQVNLQVQASENTTGTLLQNSLSDLRQALEQAGVSCGLLQSGLGDGNRGQPQHEFSAPTLARQMQHEQNKGFLTEHAYVSGDSGSRINFMA